MQLLQNLATFYHLPPTFITAHQFLLPFILLLLTFYQLLTNFYYLLYYFYQLFTSFYKFLLPSTNFHQDFSTFYQHFTNFPTISMLLMHLLKIFASKICQVLISQVINISVFFKVVPSGNLSSV